MISEQEEAGRRKCLLIFVNFPSESDDVVPHRMTVLGKERELA